jgi:hypothetical protein
VKERERSVSPDSSLHTHPVPCSEGVGLSLEPSSLSNNLVLAARSGSSCHRTRRYEVSCPKRAWRASNSAHHVSLGHRRMKQIHFPSRPPCKTSFLSLQTKRSCQTNLAPSLCPTCCGMKLADRSPKPPNSAQAQLKAKTSCPGLSFRTRLTDYSGLTGDPNLLPDAFLLKVMPNATKLHCATIGKSTDVLAPYKGHLFVTASLHIGAQMVGKRYARGGARLSDAMGPRLDRGARRYRAKGIPSVFQTDYWNYAHWKAAALYQVRAG